MTCYPQTEHAWARLCQAETHIRFSFLYGVKAPAGMDLMEFCSRRLGNRAEESQLTVRPSPGVAEGSEGRRVSPTRWCTFWVQEARQAPCRSQRRVFCCMEHPLGLEEVTSPEDRFLLIVSWLLRQQLLQKKALRVTDRARGSQRREKRVKSKGPGQPRLVEVCHYSCRTATCCGVLDRHT